MPTPTTRLFGRQRLLPGSGREQDYFPPPPALAYLGRPEYVGEGYDPGLDPVNMDTIQPTFDFGQQTSLQRPDTGAIPMGVLQALQPYRRMINETARMDRAMAEEDAAMRELSSMDYSSPKLSNNLLRIFQKYPNAKDSPNVMRTVKFFTSLNPQPESLDLDAIEDPIVYTTAVKEGWDKLPAAQAKRKMASFLSNRQIQSQAVEAGVSLDDLAAAMDKESGVYDPIKVMSILKTGKYDPTTETDPRIHNLALRNSWGNLPKKEAERQRAIAASNLQVEDAAEELGVSVDEIAQFKEPDTGLYDLGKVKGHLRQFSAKPPASDLIREVAEYQSQAPLEREAMMSPESKLAYLQKKYGDDKRTDFSKEDWDEAHATLSAQLTPSEQAIATIMRLSRPQVRKPSAPVQSTEAKSPVEIISDTQVRINGKTYSGTPEQIKAFKAKAGL